MQNNNNNKIKKVIAYEIIGIIFYYVMSAKYEIMS
jgi:hypothetical protein